MFTSWVQSIKSPWLIVLISIIISEAIYIAIALLFMDDIPRIGLILSVIVPTVAAYPISSIMLNYHAKIIIQKEELENLNIINQRLFSTIAHDIRSPIASASMLLDLTLSNTLPVEESKKQLQEVSANIDVLMAFLDDLLNWSKHQIEKKPLQPESFYSEEVLLQTVQLYRKVIAQKGLVLELGNLKSTLFMDKGSYSFAIRNVIQNALKYTPKGGKIELLVEESETSITTSVIDSGVGMSQEKINSILNKLSYNSSKGTNQELGTGFGLRTSIEYLEAQNGNIKIESQPNIGTMVSIVIPNNV